MLCVYYKFSENINEKKNNAFTTFKNESDTIVKNTIGN